MFLVQENVVGLGFPQCADFIDSLVSLAGEHGLHEFLIRDGSWRRGPMLDDRALVRHIRRPLLIVWDRLLAHRSTLVREFIGYSSRWCVTFAVRY